MKKLFLMSMVLMISLFGLVGCGEKETPIETPDTSEPSEDVVEFDEAQFMEDIKPNLAYLLECDAELYGAEFNFEEGYLAAYQNGDIALIYPVSEELPEGCEEDPAGIMYFPISNFNYLEELLAYAESYITKEAIPFVGSIDENFLEFDNQLYLVRGGRGYGMILSDPETAKYVGEEDGMQVVSIDYFIYDEYDSTANIYFAKNNDTWQIVNIIPSN